MPHSALYDDDILLWSEQQAEIVRRLGRTRRDLLPNEFDVENVAEEIESVGRSELAAVKSRIQNILEHLVKLAAEPEADAGQHWRGEILNFHAELKDRYAPSMRQRIDVEKIWQLVRKIAILNAPDLMERLPTQSLFSLDDVLVEEIDATNLAGRLQQAIASSA